MSDKTQLHTEFETQGGPLEPGSVPSKHAYGESRMTPTPNTIEKLAQDLGCSAVTVVRWLRDLSIRHVGHDLTSGRQLYAADTAERIRAARAQTPNHLHSGRSMTK